MIRYLSCIARFIRATATSLRVCYLEHSARSDESRARYLRTIARTAFIHPDMDVAARVQALHAWNRASVLEDRARRTNDKIRELIHATA